MRWPTRLTTLIIASLGTRGILVCMLQITSEIAKQYVHLFLATILDGLRSSETAIEDIFIRRFMTGTWHSLVCSEVIIKRQHNHIRIAAIIRRGLTARKMYFLVGYTEELLSNWLQCPITLELQTVADKREVIFKYI